jgi:hypothetical protein
VPDRRGVGGHRDHGLATFEQPEQSGLVVAAHPAVERRRVGGDFGQAEEIASGPAQLVRALVERPEENLGIGDALLPSGGRHVFGADPLQDLKGTTETSETTKGYPRGYLLTALVV